MRNIRRPVTTEERLRGPETSELFCAADAEITFQSSDFVQYRIHAMNLRTCSAGFSPPAEATFNEVVDLSEPSNVLDLLFHFIYPRKYPDLEDLDFKALESLAEAAEKYQVYFAMRVCNRLMRRAMPNYELAVFGYAAKHGYRDLMSEAAPLLVGLPLEKILLHIPPSYIIPWARYQDHWNRAFRRALTCHIPSGAVKSVAVSGLAKSPRSLVDLKPVFKNVRGNHTAWVSHIETDVKAIPKFSEILPKETMVTEPALVSDSRPWKAVVTFKSSDGTLYPISHHLLLASTGGFDMLGNTGISEIITLPEDTQTLTLLFQFLSSSSAPDLTKMAVDVLYRLIEAAEGYKVYSAMWACNMHMSNLAKGRPSTAFLYAAKYGYTDLLIITAPFVVTNQPLDEIAAILPENLVMPWIRYHERWANVARSAIAYQDKLKVASQGDPPSRICEGCGRNDIETKTMKIISEFACGPRSLGKLNAIFERSVACCTTRKLDLAAWCSSVEIAKATVPSFEDFL